MKDFGTTVSVNEVEFTASTTVEYTGVSIPIKANTPFVLVVQAIYSRGEPKELWLLTSSTEFVDFRKLAGGAFGATSTCGIYSTATTFYVWTKYNNATTNFIRYRLVYFE